MPISNYKLKKLNDSIENARNRLKDFLKSQGIEIEEDYTLRKLIKLIPSKNRPVALDNTLYGHSMVKLSDNLVLISGGATNADTVTNDNYVLNLNTNIKINKLQLDTPRQKHSVVNWDSNILISGGLNGGLIGNRLNTNQIYNIDTNTFITKLNLPSSRERFTSNYNNNTVYMLGGITGSEWDTINNFHVAYNLETNTYVNKASIGKYAGQSTVHNNAHFFYFGGQENQYSEVRNWVKAYNKNTDTFVNKQNLGVARSTLTATYLKDDKVLLSGGYKLNNVKSSKNEIYNISANTYTSKRDLTPPRSDHASLCLGDKVVFVGGKTTLTEEEVRGTPINTIDFYDFENNEFYRRD